MQNATSSITRLHPAELCYFNIQHKSASDLHEGSESLILLLPALYKLQSEGLVTAEGSYCPLDLLLLCSAELQSRKHRRVQLYLHFM